MQDVGKQQLLVLFLVVHAQFDQFERTGLWTALQQFFDSGIHALPELQHLLQAWPRK